MATDTGFFQINDLDFQVPPEAIKVNRRSVNNYWQTLRTRSSIKLSSGYSMLDIELNIKVIANSTELEKLTNLIAQVRVTPFCWVENQYLRNSILGGKSRQAMVLAMKQIELSKSAGEDTNIIEVYMLFSWFNYFPYMRDWQYKEDIFVSKSVSNPKESKAWRVMYAAERKRGDYVNPGTLSNSNVVLDLRQFMVVGKKNYKQLKQDIHALQDLRLQLLNYTPPKGASEFSGMPEDIMNSLIDRAGRDEAERLIEGVFGHSTSIGKDVTLSEILHLVETDITQKQKEIESWGNLVKVIEPEWQATIDKKSKPIEIVEKLDAKIGDKDIKGIDNQLLMESKQVLDFEKVGLIVTGISISFENILATMPVIGHPYPSYQHIGSTDAVVTISFVTTKETGIQAISSFYTICEDQSRKFRQIPAGSRNIHVNNQITRMCGLKEFIVEDLKQGTQPGQPGTYYGELVLVNNPITSETREQLAPGQSFTTSSAIRLKIIEVLDKFIRFKSENFTIDDGDILEKGWGHLNKRSNEPIPQKVRSKRVLSFARGGTPSRPEYYEEGYALKNQATGKFAEKDISADPRQIYVLAKRLGDRDALIREYVLQYMGILAKAFEGISSTFFMDWQRSRFDVSTFAILTIANDEVVGVGRLKEDLVAIAKRLKHQAGYKGGQRDPSTDSSDRHTYALGQLDQLKTFIHEQWQEMKDEPVAIQHNKIAEIFNRAAELTDPGDFTGIRVEGGKAVSKFYLDRYFAKQRQIFIDEYLADFHDKMLLLLDKLQRSYAFDLPEFDSVRDEIEKNTGGLPTTGNNYPDFPLTYVLNELRGRTDWPKIDKILENAQHLEGLGVYNIGLEALINPDFYLYNRVTDSTSEIIGWTTINQARDAIKVSQGRAGQREKAEKDWVTNVYERHILGPTRATRIREDVRKGTSNTKRRGKIEQFRKELNESKDEDAKRVLGDIIRKEERLAEGVWHYNDLEGSLGPTLFENTPKEGASEGVFLEKTINEHTDILNTTILERQGSLRPDRELYAQCQQRFDVENSLDELSESEYRPPPPFDPNKDPIWVWPTEDEAHVRTTGHYGDIKKLRGFRFHEGIDIAGATSGETTSLHARAAAGGTITKVTKEYKKLGGSWPALGGKERETTPEIHIKHANGWKTVYKHMQWKSIQDLSNFFKSSKDKPLKVEAGEFLGFLGDAGYSKGAHLHFEMWKNGRHVDPLRVLKSPHHKSQGPITGIDPNNESLFTKSIEQFEKELQSGQGYSLMRAYPTFRLYFIESDLEERKIFAFDDFFSYSAVQDIQLVRSRKIAADLLVLTVTNVSGVLTNRKFRGQGRENLHKDIKENIAKEDPRDIGARNTLRENPVASLMVQPGIQVQLRLGYDANPFELERVFNGIITDVQLSEDDNLVQITCQSFGIELTQKVYGEVKKFGGWLSDTGKTGEVLEELMAQPEVVHFGRWEHGTPNIYKGLLTSRFKFVPTPADDNIFAPTGRKGIFGLFDSSPKYIMYNTTIWDTFQEMTLRHPAYIACPVPYEGLMGPRMTMFFGVPNQLYFARDPTLKEKESYKKIKKFIEKSNDIIEEIKATHKSGKELSSLTKAAVGTITALSAPFLGAAAAGLSLFLGNMLESGDNDRLKEIYINRALLRFAKNRGFIKPFRSYHVLTSTMHILKNTIASSSWNTFNTVTLQYEDNAPKVNKDIETLSFDDSESFTLKCDAGLPDEEVRELMASWNNCVGEEMAKRYAVALLWNSLKEGYSGSIITIGNPSIKPHDICYVFDEYNDMFGPVEVEQVVHRFSQNTGFVTEITPDMCIHVNQASTLAVQDAMGLVVEAGLKEIGLQSLASILGSTRVVERTAGIPRVDSINPEAASATDKLAGAALRAGASIAFTPYSMIFWPGKLVGSFILKKIVTRSQLAHPFRYSPLVQQGKSMIGGTPTRYVDGSFIQGIRTWFKDTGESIPLYMDSLYDKIVVNEWFHTQGSKTSILLGD